MQRTKRQHTVPRCYLARFCKDGRGLFVFDKATGRSFASKATDASVRSCFYDFPADVTARACPDEDVDLQMVEKDFSRMEGIANQVLAEIIAEADRRRVITPIHRAEIAPYIIIQSLRTSLAREMLREMMEKTAQALATANLRWKMPEVADDFEITATLDRKFLPITQARPIYDQGLIDQLSDILLGHIWYVGINRSMQPFYTSDHPVIRKAHVHREGRSFTGFRSPGIEIAFPLTSRHALVLLERSHHRGVADRHGKAVLLDALEVDRLNELQVLRCHRQVYCEAEAFGPARHTCKRHPETCAPNRPQMEVRHSGDTIAVLFHA